MKTDKIEGIYCGDEGTMEIVVAAMNQIGCTVVDKYTIDGEYHIDVVKSFFFGG